MTAPRRLARPRLRLCLVPLAVLALAAGCTKKPSEDQCEAFADHLVELLVDSRDSPTDRVRKLARTKHDEIVAACVKEGTAEEVECVLAQPDLAAVEANCKS